MVPAGRQKAAALVLAGCAALTVPVAVLTSAGSGAGAVRQQATSGLGRPLAARAAAPDAYSPAPARSGAAAGACPAGGLTWSGGPLTVVEVDPALQEWMIQEQGMVANRSAAAIVVGNGVARIGRTDAGGRSLPVLDLPLTPLGSLTLEPGQAEPYSGAILVQSATPPVDLGAGLSSASWAVPPVAAGCAPPAGAAPTPGRPAGARLD